MLTSATAYCILAVVRQAWRRLHLAGGIEVSSLTNICPVILASRHQASAEVSRICKSVTIQSRNGPLILAPPDRVGNGKNNIANNWRGLGRALQPSHYQLRLRHCEGSDKQSRVRWDRQAQVPKAGRVITVSRTCGGSRRGTAGPCGTVDSFHPRGPAAGRYELAMTGTASWVRLTR